MDQNGSGNSKETAQAAQEFIGRGKNNELSSYAKPIKTTVFARHGKIETVQVFGGLWHWDYNLYASIGQISGSREAPPCI